MKSLTTIAVLLLTLLLISSCSTIFMGANQYVSFDSEPRGATVYIDGKGVGITPFKLNISKAESPEITFVKEGYKKETFLLSRYYVHWTTYLNYFSILGSPFYFVDAVSGSYSIYCDENLKIPLYKMPDGIPSNLSIKAIDIDLSKIQKILSHPSTIKFSTESISDKIYNNLTLLGIKKSKKSQYTLKAKILDISKILYNECNDSHASKTEISIEWTLSKNENEVISKTCNAKAFWASSGSTSIEKAFINSLFVFLNEADLSRI